MSEVDPLKITADMSEAAFAEVIGSAPRKVREILYSQYGLKEKKKKFGIKKRLAHSMLPVKLQEKLKTATSKQEKDLCNELIRAWLYTKRPMLKATLDHLEVKNDDGLVEVETNFFGKLSKEKVKELFDHLSTNFPPEHVRIYLQFVGVKHVP